MRGRQSVFRTLSDLLCTEGSSVGPLRSSVGTLRSSVGTLRTSVGPLRSSCSPSGSVEVVSKLVYSFVVVG